MDKKIICRLEMSLLGNFRTIEELENEAGNGYTTPAVIREDKESISFKKAVALSTALHPSVVILIGMICLGLSILGISLFERPKVKETKDIEFVLVDKEDKPINKKTPYRADINSRAGGKHDPKRKVSMPSPAPAKKAKPAVASAPAKKQPVKKQSAAPKKTTPQKVTTPNKTTSSQAQKSTQTNNPKPQPPSIKHNVAPVAAPKPVTKPTSAFNVPVSPKAPTGSYSTGPVGGTGTASSGSKPTSSGAGGHYSPSPSLSPSHSSGGAGKSSGSSGSAGGSGHYGNPGPGNPNGRPGIDAVAEPDFGPYMRELQRRIKLNWDPPKGNESKRVVLLFKIAKDGRLLSTSVYKSSGLASADAAALNAVKLTAPFRPLPANFRGSSVDIQFTFDYNVFGASSYR